MKKNAFWLKWMGRITASLSVFAFVMAQVTCLGQYYQPEVPEKLRSHE